MLDNEVSPSNSAQEILSVCYPCQIKYPCIIPAWNPNDSADFASSFLNFYGFVGGLHYLCLDCAEKGMDIDV